MTQLLRLLLTTDSSRLTTFTLSRFYISRRQVFKNICGCTCRRHVSKIRWTLFTNNDAVLFYNSVPLAMSWSDFYIFQRHILSTNEIQPKQVSHTSVCVCFKFLSVLDESYSYSANLTTINVFRGVIGDKNLAIMANAWSKKPVLSPTLVKEMVIVLWSSYFVVYFSVL